MMSALRGKGECLHQMMAVIGCVSIKVTVSGVKSQHFADVIYGRSLALSLAREIWEGAAALQREWESVHLQFKWNYSLSQRHALCSALCKIIVQNREKRMNDRRLKQLGNWNELLFFRQTGRAAHRMGKQRLKPRIVNLSAVQLSNSTHSCHDSRVCPSNETFISKW